MSKVLTANVNELFPNPWNSNDVSPGNQAKLDESMKRFGVFKPIVVREVESGGSLIFEILGGEHRWQSAKRIGLSEVPIFNLGAIDDKKAKAISLADNARYGEDDDTQLAKIMEDIGDLADLTTFLPYTDADVSSIFDSTTIALDELELDESFDAKSAPAEPPAAKMPKTHTLMRFKVPLADAEKITKLLVTTQKRYEYTTADDMTNAGDALVHLLLSSTEAPV